EKFPEIPLEMEYLIHKLMAKNREDRFASAGHLIEYLENLEKYFAHEEHKNTLSSRLTSTRKLFARKDSAEKTDRLPLFSDFHYEKKENNVNLTSSNTKHVVDDSTIMLTPNTNQKVRIQIGSSGVECIPEKISENIIESKTDHNALEVRPYYEVAGLDENMSLSITSYNLSHISASTDQLLENKNSPRQQTQRITKIDEIESKTKIDKTKIDKIESKSNAKFTSQSNMQVQKQRSKKIKTFSREIHHHKDYITKKITNTPALQQAIEVSKDPQSKFSFKFFNFTSISLREILLLLSILFLGMIWFISIFKRTQQDREIREILNDYFILGEFQAARNYIQSKPENTQIHNQKNKWLEYIKKAENTYVQQKLGNKGWFGENMPIGLIRDKQRGSYIWSKDNSIMVYVGEGFVAIDETIKNAKTVMTKINIPAFYIDKYELTNLQYNTFCQKTGARFAPFSENPNFNKPLQPVTGITWFEAQVYARWVEKRLPSEIEWEKASRGGLLIPDW
ncbi:MAG: SUMF1/EgtB/PvdO family nonheme iron enzyme, partial [Candidatus Calescibacterium sp.]|nr:SUMF1/EgtB/PvdO family nonheme iron enzyme [Candidatus Calescibacterium sp.]